MILLPFDFLPQDKILRSKLLHEYFIGQLVSTTLIDNVWSIELHFPDFIEYYVDPLLMEGLDWWQSGLQVSEIPLAVKKEKNFQLSLNDSWTLFAWSQWLSLYVDKNGLPSEIVILHVDDHDDLMSPRIWYGKPIWSDAITRQSFDILDSYTISQAIKSGAIGIGSFIVPLLHVIPKVQIRHFCATGYSVTRQGLYSLTPTVTPDQILSHNHKRLAVERKRCHNLSSAIDKKSIYKVTADFNEWLEDLPENAPILLHIDMDYFNNRFNGDSDWKMYTNLHDPSREEVIRSIDAMFEALHSNEVINKICDITIALSPGFFPAELWESSIEHIGYHLNQQKL